MYPVIKNIRTPSLSIQFPYLKRQSAILERVQKGATEMMRILGELSYTERLVKVDLPSLKFPQTRRDPNQMILMGLMILLRTAVLIQENNLLVTAVHHYFIHNSKDV